MKTMISAFLSIALASVATAEDSAVVVTPAGSPPATEGSAQNFTGKVVVSGRFTARPPGRLGGATVAFSPGARTAWHTHALGQTLIVTSGVGRVQHWGGPIQEIRAGDTVWIPAGVKHWHGASPNEMMIHLAISEAVESGSAVQWMEHVTDDQYGQ